MQMGSTFYILHIYVFHELFLRNLIKSDSSFMMDYNGSIHATINLPHNL
jgi:hypothetical protein